MNDRSRLRPSCHAGSRPWAIEVYEIDRLDFADAYVVACAEASGIGRIASFDKNISRIEGIQRIEPR